MKKGFTLAEVLITLAIIGVVAALTIPVVVHKYQQKAMYTQFMKSYNALSNVLNLAIAENGSPDSWSFEGENLKGAVETYILPYFKVVSKCTVSDSGCGNYSFTAISGDDFGFTYGQFLSMMAGSDSDLYTLADGSNVMPGLSLDYTDTELDGVSFIFDTNGAKGPNTLGRDMFYIEYKNVQTENTSGGRYISHWGWTNLYQHVKKEANINTCDPGGPAMIDESTPNGAYCAGRLLVDGKMAY